MVSQRYDTFWQRLGAAFLDTIVHICFMLPVAIFIGNDTPLGALLWGIILFLTYPVYSVWMHAQFGQTLGKMACKVVVLDVSENRLPKFRQALLRDSVYIVISLLSLFVYWNDLFAHGFEYAVDKVDDNDSILTYVSCSWAILEIVTMLFHPKRRALHDLIGSTVVLRGSRKGWLKRKKVTPSDSASFQPVDS